MEVTRVKFYYLETRKHLSVRAGFAGSKYRYIGINEEETNEGCCAVVCCRFMVEFGKDLIVIQSTVSGKLEQFILKDLLPNSFGPEDLE